MKKKLQFKIVDENIIELEGPVECIKCGGHMMVDFTYLDQVSETISCPYCRARGKVEQRE